MKHKKIKRAQTLVVIILNQYLIPIINKAESG